MPPTDLAPLGGQQVAQHTRPCVGTLKVQLVQPAHERKIARRHGNRLVVDAAPGDPQGSALLRHRQRMTAVDHRLALGNPALPSAASKKSFSSVSSPILACSALMSTGGADVGGAFEKLILPDRDLVDVNIKLLRQLSKRAIALDSSECHFCLESRGVVPARSLLHGVS